MFSRYSRKKLSFREAVHKYSCPAIHMHMQGGSTLPIFHKAGSMWKSIALGGSELIYSFENEYSHLVWHSICMRQKGKIHDQWSSLIDHISSDYIKSLWDQVFYHLQWLSGICDHQQKLLHQWVVSKTPLLFSWASTMGVKCTCKL